MQPSDDTWTTEGDDLRTQNAVLQRVIEVHPAQLTVAELVRELAGEEPEFAERDAIERAVGDLAGIGLLHRNDEFLMPTRAALRYSELLDG